MKILIYGEFVLPAFVASSVEKLAHNLAIGLFNKKIEVDIASYANKSINGIKNINILDFNDLNKNIEEIFCDYDLIHFHTKPKFVPNVNYLYTCYNTSEYLDSRFINTIFINKNQATCYASSNYIKYCLNFDNFSLNSEPHNYLLYFFEGNLRKCNKAISIAQSTNENILVLGTKVWWNSYEKLSYHEYVDDEQREEIISNAKAIISLSQDLQTYPFMFQEALSYGTPLIYNKNIFANDDFKDLAIACQSTQDYIDTVSKLDKISRKKIYFDAKSHFNFNKMLDDYITLYEKIIKYNYV